MNLIVLTGRLTKENEIRYVSNGTALLSNTIAVNRNFKNQDGVYESDFFNFTTFGHTAEYLNSYSSKGDKILIKGRLQNRSYEDKEGNKRYATDIIVETAEIEDRKSKTATEKAIEEKVETNDIYADFGEQINIDDNFLD